MSGKTQKIIFTVLTAFICFVFIQSLFFKFAAAEEPIHIFSTLDAWAQDSFGLGGLFFPSGLGAIFGGAIFNATAIGIAELICSALLIAGLLLGSAQLHILGALGAMATMTGAIFFHLFTPLGVEVLGDGGALFMMACFVWLSGLAIIVLRLRAAG